MKKQFRRGVLYIRDGRAPIPKKESTSRVMSANRAKKTGPELVLQKAVRKAGVRGARFNFKGVPGSPDIAFSAKRLAVFVHGCFWHHCPKCDLPLPRQNRLFWRAKFIRNRERDQKKLQELKSGEWKTLVIWEHEIKKDPARAVQRIVKRLA